ncbi:MAG TPA: outer membrane beta-barrel family protein, partial [Hanamia sp.]|nr:outer membrane beta-barrel family protein [Hanamia sp.]
KQTVSGFKNNLSFEKLDQYSWIKDETLSAKYKLNENYSAAYVSFDVHFNDKTEAKLGFRYEYTNSNLGTETIKNIVDRRYGNLFPTLFLSHSLDDNNKINLSFNTRINRPAFTDLAPFTYYVDAKTVLTGNPALQPSTTNTIKGDYIYKTYLFSISYSLEDNAITGFQPKTDSVTLKTILSPQNLENQKTVSAVISLPVKMNNWWTMQFNITCLWQQVNAIYQKEPVRLSYGNINIYGSQQFNLPKGFKAELSGFYQSKSLSGLSKAKSLGTLDIGLKKKISEKSSLQFNASNILNSMKFRAVTDLPEQNLVSNLIVNFSQPTYKATFTHNFGKEKLKGKRERSTGAEEEKGRVNNN